MPFLRSLALLAALCAIAACGPIPLSDVDGDGDREQPPDGGTISVTPGGK